MPRRPPHLELRQILEQLPVARATREQRLADADAALVGTVQEARRSGASWTDIGEGLGISRQAAWERFGRVL